jgi:hypothetical protein
MFCNQRVNVFLRGAASTQVPQAKARSGKGLESSQLLSSKTSHLGSECAHSCFHWELEVPQDACESCSRNLWVSAGFINYILFTWGIQLSLQVDLFD